MSYRNEEGELPASNMRSYMCMRAFPYEVGGNAENIEAHKWLNAMRKEGWHLVSMSTSIGKYKMDCGGMGHSATTEGNVITFVMEGTKPDPQAGKGGQDNLWPVEEALRNTQTYGHNQW